MYHFVINVKFKESWYFKSNVYKKFFEELRSSGSDYGIEYTGKEELDDGTTDLSFYVSRASTEKEAEEKLIDYVTNVQKEAPGVCEF